MAESLVRKDSVTISFVGEDVCRLQTEDTDPTIRYLSEGPELSLTQVDLNEVVLVQPVVVPEANGNVLTTSDSSSTGADGDLQQKEELMQAAESADLINAEQSGAYHLADLEPVKPAPVSLVPSVAESPKLGDYNSGMGVHANSGSATLLTGQLKSLTEQFRQILQHNEDSDLAEALQPICDRQSSLVTQLSKVTGPASGPATLAPPSQMSVTFDDPRDWLDFTPSECARLKSEDLTSPSLDSNARGHPMATLRKGRRQLTDATRYSFAFKKRQTTMTHRDSTVESQKDSLKFRRTKPKTGRPLGLQKGFWLMAAERFKHTTIGLAWDALQMLLAIVSIATTILETYEPAIGLRDEAQGYNVYKRIDLVVDSFLIMDLILQATIAVNLWQWITRWFTWVDIISLVPMIIMAFGPDQSDDFDLLRIVRLMRLLRVMRAHRMLYITPSGSISREIALLVYTISVLVLIAAGFFHVIEPGIQTFHDGIYFVVVTITTLGYGDLLPSTAVSRMSVCIFILLAIIIVPMRINIVVEKFGILSKYAGVYKRQTKKHVVVTGIFDHKSLRTFLCEFFSSQRGYTCCRVCILGTAYPDKEMQLLLQGRLASERTQYLHGSPTNAQDLHRAQVHSAVAIFIMTDKATPDEQVKHVDALNILTTISMRQFNDTVPIYVQALSSHASSVFYDMGATAVVCVNELRMQLLAASCYCPGLHTLATSLVTQTQDSEKPWYASDNEEWLKEWHSGRAQGVFELATPRRLAGHNYHYVAGEIYSAFPNCLFLGVRLHDGGAVLLNPRDGHVIDTEDTMIIMAKNETDATSVAAWAADNFPEGKEPSDTKEVEVQCSSSLIAIPVHDDEYVRLPEVDREATASYEFDKYTFDPGMFALIDEIPAEALNFKIQMNLHRVVVIPRAPSNMHNHIVVLGWSSHAVDFVMVLRSRRLNSVQPIIFVSPVRPPDSQLQPLVYFEAVYVLVCELDKCFRRVALSQARTLVVLADKQSAEKLEVKNHVSEAIAAERLDHHAITLTMKMHTFDGSVGSIVALQDQHNGRFLAASLNTVQGLPGSSSVKSFRSLRRVSLLTTRAHMPAQIFSEILPDQLLGSLFYSGCSLEIIQNLLGPPDFHSHAGEKGSQLFLLPLPAKFLADFTVQDRTYKRLFHHVLRRKQLLLGLLKNADLLGRACVVPSYEGEELPPPRSRLAYVSLAPSPNSLVSVVDLMYVLLHKQDEERFHVSK